MFLKHLYSAHGSDGLDYEVHVYVERNQSGSRQQLPFEHISKVCLADGSELRVLGHGHYLVVASGVHLHATDADAV